MADKKISELTQILGSAVDDANDELAIVDTSETTTKAITRAELLSGISNLSLGAISETITATAFDAFVYDTSQDSDGGAWRKRMQNKSWYNETLNTATRGSRREFPSVALIVATATTVTIYDADDPSLPMWDVPLSGSSSVTSVDALNGKVYIGRASSGADKLLDYPADTVYQPYSNSTFNGFLPYNIAEAPAALTGTVVATSTDVIAGPSTNDVAMTVLSGAPIDAATGLAVPTIAVATDGGTSVINNDGTVADSTQTVGILKVWFNEDGRLFYSDEGSDQVYYTDTFASDGFNAGGTHYDADAAPYTLTTNVVDIAGNAFAHTSGVTLLDEAATKTEGLAAYITDEYSTGWMVGDIKGAFLSSTDTASLVGTELVTNGTFDTDVTGWTAARSATLTWVSGEMQIAHGGTDFPQAQQTLTTVAGKRYKLQVEQKAGVSLAAVVGTGAGGNQLGSVSGTGSLTLDFVATSATSFLTLQANASGAVSVTVDNVSVDLADEDRSVSNNGLVINGTITRTAVATGAELVGYSGFSASNYLEQPYNSDLDFGTGDFCIMGWSKGAGTESIFIRQDETVSSSYGSGAYVRIYLNNGVLVLLVDGTTFNTGVTVSGSSWSHVVALREGGDISVYINGRLVSSGSNSSDLTNTNAVSRVGMANFGGSLVDAHDGSLALLRISATAPTAAQIKKSYEDEKYLFQENADAVLTNSTVAALAFDPDTNLLHVGGDVGRDEFQGLRRVGTTAGAVTSAISAQDDLVATGKATTVDVVKPEINLREILTKLSS